jgi:YggT family protein
VNPENPLVVILMQITEPILGPMRRIIPRLGMFDISPIIAILILQFLSQAVVSGT